MAECACHQTPATPRLKASHADLLVPCYARRIPQPVDAIIVPSSRDAANVEAAAALATSLHCPLLVLSSVDSVPAQVLARTGRFRGLAAHVDATSLRRSRRSWLSLSTMGPGQGRPVSYADRSVKRNVGLLVARMMRWERVLFLDDDMRALNAEVVMSAAAHIGERGPRTVSWRARRFADNSVVCHAHRAAEGRQDVFAGAGALAVHVPGRLPFFPAVYNEDWLFFYDFVTRRELGSAGFVHQIPFDPFHDPERARNEEFGDLLAEGLFALIHEHRSVTVACLPSYWPTVICERHRFIDRIADDLWRIRESGRTHTWDGHEIPKVLFSLNAARETLETITPEDLAEFTSLWRRDLYTWNAHLPSLPHFSRIWDALSWLGIDDVHFSQGV